MRPCVCFAALVWVWITMVREAAGKVVCVSQHRIAQNYTPTPPSVAGVSRQECKIGDPHVYIQPVGLDLCTSRRVVGWDRVDSGRVVGMKCAPWLPRQKTCEEERRERSHARAQSFSNPSNQHTAPTPPAPSCARFHPVEPSGLPLWYSPEVHAS